MPTVQSKPDLSLWVAVTSDALFEINETKMIGKGAQEYRCLALCESPDAAWERSSWFTSDRERFLLKATVTTKGVGHFTRELTEHGEPILSRLPGHGTWRFHREMPFHVEDTDGNLLFHVEEEAALVTGPP